ncbi:MAG: helix-turn-helix transcriptional regulator, partial [Acidimicrobiales bacterium]|nr:helix-turn-helix transcriptional regulator [Acidimicrobiales bacterium]
PSRVGLRDIAEAANVNVALIYRHLGTKDELLRLVADRLRRSGQAEIARCETWDEIVELLFLAPDEYVGFTRLVAWLLLEGIEPADLDTLLPPVSDVLGRLGAPDSSTTVTAVVAMSLGWHLFEPLLRSWADGSEPDGGAGDGVRDRLIELARSAPQVRPS